jgi:hypothetical protein
VTPAFLLVTCLFIGIVGLSSSILASGISAGSPKRIMLGILMFLSVVLTAIYLAVAVDCNFYFPLRLFEDGQCSASDKPYEVLAALGLVIASVGLAIFLVTSLLLSIIRWPAK